MNKEGEAMLDERFARVAVVGTGMMGPGIALTLARGGCRVALYGRTEASVADQVGKAGLAVPGTLRRDRVDAAGKMRVRSARWVDADAVLPGQQALRSKGHNPLIHPAPYDLVGYNPAQQRSERHATVRTHDVPGSQ
jgi:2-polyprenyl-6-methoxyphenol hydroxylase-like FAD-dependent oxidoreductase